MWYGHAVSVSISEALNRRMRWVRHVERMGKMESEYIITVGKPEGKRLIGHK
jgi:hypothetical protein